MTANFIQKRQLGIKLNIGDTDKLFTSVYSSIAPQRMWNVDWTSYESNVGYGGVFNLEFSPDGSLLVAACEKKSVLLFDAVNEKPIKVLENCHQDCVNCVKFLDNRLFATCSDDSTVALFDTRNLKQKIRTLRGHSNWVKNIEYSKKDCLLVTSGFDGSIFTWDLNSYTEHSLTYQKVFHTPGLMRCRLSPDASKLVICTTGGYLIIIHDLDLSTLSRDLQGFRPNLYRLMQVRRQYLPIAAKYDQLFSKTQKVNRVELVSDFPKGNDAEVVSSLQIHPQGWCSLSRNISYDESSEWTCIHDIQEFAEDDGEQDASDFYEVNISELFPFNQLVQNNSSISTLSSQNGSSGSSSSSNNSNTNEADEQNQQQGQPPPPNIQIEIEPPSEDDTPANENENEPRGRIHNVRSSLINTDEILDLWAGNTPFIQRTRRTPSDRPYRLNTGIMTVPTRLTRFPPHIKQNRRRMLNFIEEPNKGKGFIKELCFSSDGRLISSPYGCGIRLLSFSKDCQELPDVLAPNQPAQKLHQLVCTEKHPDIVVSTKFSPRSPVVVSGCLRGGIIWNQPI